MNLLKQIETNFPKLRPESATFLPDTANSGELRILAGDLSSFYIEDLPPYLGAVLYHSAKNPPVLPLDWEWERLIYFLDANLNQAHVAGVAADRDVDEFETERKVRLERQRDFERLTLGQTQTIRDWLLFAQVWPSMQRLLCEIADAVSYWSKLEEEKQGQQRALRLEMYPTSEPKHGEDQRAKE